MTLNLNNINSSFFVMPNIELSDRVKEKLDVYKNDSGSKTYSDAINFCLIQIELLKQNQAFLIENQKFLKENQKFLIENQKLLLEIRKIKSKKEE